MPIKLIEPRPGKTPYYSGRGTHLGQYIDRSTKARERSLAIKIIKKWEREIEQGEFAKPGEPTFASALIVYLFPVSTAEDVTGTPTDLSPSRQRQFHAKFPKLTE